VIISCTCFFKNPSLTSTNSQDGEIEVYKKSKDSRS